MVLKGLNAQIRRIDLTCKLLSPLLIASINTASTVVAIWTILIMTCMSVPTEYLFIEKVTHVHPLYFTAQSDNSKVYKLIPRLRQQRPSQVTNNYLGSYSFVGTEESEVDSTQHNVSSWVSATRRIFPVSSVTLYVKDSAFLPSLAYAFLHFTVLSFSGRMIAFLLAVGYNSFQVGVARAVSTIAELSATWISPRITRRVGCVRSGSWSITWQTAWLTFGVGCFLKGGLPGVTGLVTGVIFSCIGLWGFELAVQNIIQDVRLLQPPRLIGCQCRYL